MIEMTINLFWILAFAIGLVLIFVVARTYNDKLNYKKDIHFKDKDVEITSEAFNKIGEVKNGTPNEVILNLQNVENNKEIHTHDKKIDELEEKVEFLLNENGKLKASYEILKNRFDALTKAVGRAN